MSHLLQRYYKTDHWKNFSAALLDDKEIICEICGRPRWKLLEKGPGSHKKNTGLFMKKV